MEGVFKVKIGKSFLSLIVGDITQQSNDVIVNAANSSLAGGGGVDGAIHRAGGSEILAECRKIIAKIGRLPAGHAVITSAGNLPSKYVIHTVGPIWHGGNKNEEEILKSCYRKSLRLANEYKLSSIAFPSISTGAYRYPLDMAAEAAINEVVAYLLKEDGLKDVFFVLYNESVYKAYFKALKYANAG